MMKISTPTPRQMSSWTEDGQLEQGQRPERSPGWLNHGKGASSGTTANRTVPASASGGGEARSGSWSWRLTPWSGRGKIRELELAPDTMVRQRQENQALSGRRIVILLIQLVKVLLFYAAMTANCFNLIFNKIA